MNRKSGYRDMEKYKRTCRDQKRRYYRKSAIYGNSYYTEEECQMILDHEMTDTELSKLIHHSVASIQTKRSRLLQRKNTR